MAVLLTAAQMRAIEEAAMASGAVTGLELMERAGAGVVTAIFDEWPELAEAPQGAVVLCGPGNNGGDGFVVARLLKARGWDVEVFLYGDPEKLPPDARSNYDAWQTHGDVVGLTMPNPTTDEIEQVDRATAVTGGDPGPALIIDAVFGTGLSRPLGGLRALIEACQLEGNPLHDRNAGRPFVVSLDMPSGVCSDSGRILGDDPGLGIGADLVVTFHAAKRGHVLSHGAQIARRLRVCDIGLAEHARAALRVRHAVPPEKPGWLARHVTRSVTAGRAQHPELDKPVGNKFDHGHALVLSGGAGRTGAARLAARGALRIGSGLVTLGVPPSAQLEVATQVTAIMLARVGDAVALEAVLKDARINALCVGPSLGLSDEKAALTEAALKSGRAIVLDADALTLIAQDPALFAALHAACVLTPHGGEFARLFPDLAERLAAPASAGPAYSKIDATREAAARCGAVVLFKGPDTVIAHPDGRAAVHAATQERAAPWLATAGAGDVLAGFITGLLARGFAPMQAAETAAWLHVECARLFGPGLIAEDLPEQLPDVLRAFAP
ncbi:MAG: NAD(P)H-hydrate dehydratase [Pseudomonadota bacterium]